jgi:hypothetical protein
MMALFSLVNQFRFFVFMLDLKDIEEEKETKIQIQSLPFLF